MKMFTLLPLIAIFGTSGVAALLSTCPQKIAQTNFNTTDNFTSVAAWSKALILQQTRLMMMGRSRSNSGLVY
uniref:Uncharacterized protein n=1 Tax=Timema douglasi TaxID=61478 RepID=A0A7R8VY79_TIMDO|nr:unnamed protein product [Timema douglasi]